jgi:pyruvate kinase
VDNLKTKIIATVGPSSLDFQTFQSLIDEGVDYLRVNSEYGDEYQYKTIFDNLNKAKKEKEIKIIWDIKDVGKLKYAIDNNIQIIALSFVENADQITEVKKLIPQAFVISKIESENGIKNFDSILEISEGIMVARGDLGKNVFLENVPPLQKEYTQKTICKKKFLITATEMLLSMVENPKPTMAEVSDVANAVFDQSSAVMLSEETAIGKYPVESVRIMKKIIQKAEEWYYRKNKFCPTDINSLTE